MQLIFLYVDSRIDYYRSGNERRHHYDSQLSMFIKEKYVCSGLSVFPFVVGELNEAQKVSGTTYGGYCLLSISTCTETLTL